MKKHFVIWVAALLLATAAWAADEETGKIVSIDAAASSFTILTDDGDRVVYRTEPSTRMMRDGATIALGDLAVGTRVEVTAPEAEGTAPRLASQVEFVGSEAGAGTQVTGDVEAGDARIAGEAGPEVGPGGVQARADADVDVDEDDRMRDADRLPSTASPLPLIGLLGASAVFAGLLVRKLRR